MNRVLPAWVIGEFFGTFILIFFGCGSVCAAVTTGADIGAFQVATVWGLAVATAIYMTAALSGAHLNPSVTLAMAAWGGFPRNRVIGYVATQMMGAFVAAAFLYVIFGGMITDFESKKGIIRGEPGSEASAMIFGEYYPNPGGKLLLPSDINRMPLWRAFIAEVMGTGLLVLVIFCVTDPNNKDRPVALTAAVIGLTVTILISVLGPLTMACFNPARDLGPRLLSCLVGWGTIPFITNGSGWWAVYIVAPLLGGWLGGFIYWAFFKKNYLLYKHDVISE